MYGPELNKNKCEILRFNSKSEKKERCGINIVSKIKYLHLTNYKWWKNLFEIYKEKANNNSITFTNQLYSVLGTEC